MNSAIISRLSDKAKELVPTNTYQVDAWIKAYNEAFATLLLEETMTICDEETARGIRSHFDL